MQVKARMRAGLEAGLKASGPSAIKMLPTFVYRKPDGTGRIFTHSSGFNFPTAGRLKFNVLFF